MLRIPSLYSLLYWGARSDDTLGPLKGKISSREAFRNDAQKLRSVSGFFQFFFEVPLRAFRRIVLEVFGEENVKQGSTSYLAYTDPNLEVIEKGFNRKRFSKRLVFGKLAYPVKWAEFVLALSFSVLRSLFEVALWLIVVSVVISVVMPVVLAALAVAICSAPVAGVITLITVLLNKFFLSENNQIDGELYDATAVLFDVSLPSDPGTHPKVFLLSAFCLLVLPIFALLVVVVAAIAAVVLVTAVAYTVFNMALRISARLLNALTSPVNTVLVPLIRLFKEAIQKPSFLSIIKLALTLLVGLALISTLVAAIVLSGGTAAPVVLAFLKGIPFLGYIASALSPVMAFMGGLGLIGVVATQAILGTVAILSGFSLVQYVFSGDLLLDLHRSVTDAVVLLGVEFSKAGEFFQRFQKFLLGDLAERSGHTMFTGAAQEIKTTYKRDDAEAMLTKTPLLKKQDDGTLQSYDRELKQIASTGVDNARPALAESFHNAAATSKGSHTTPSFTAGSFWAGVRKVTGIEAVANELDDSNLVGKGSTGYDRV